MPQQHRQLIYSNTTAVTIAFKLVIVLCISRVIVFLRHESVIIDRHCALELINIIHYYYDGSNAPTVDKVAYGLVHINYTKVRGVSLKRVTARRW